METAIPETITFTTLADFYHSSNIYRVTEEKITITKDEEGVVRVDGQQAEVSHNGIQLRFTNDKGVYIIFNYDPKDLLHHHQPPLPIAEMFQALCPEEAN